MTTELIHPNLTGKTAKKCTCGHAMNDHLLKNTRRKGVSLKRWRGYCQWEECDCQLFVEERKK